MAKAKRRGSKVYVADLSMYASVLLQIHSSSTHVLNERFVGAMKHCLPNWLRFFYPLELALIIFLHFDCLYVIL